MGWLLGCWASPPIPFHGWCCYCCWAKIRASRNSFPPPARGLQKLSGRNIPFCSSVDCLVRNRQPFSASGYSNFCDPQDDWPETIRGVFFLHLCGKCSVTGGCRRHKDTGGPNPIPSRHTFCSCQVWYLQESNPRVKKNFLRMASL